MAISTLEAYFDESGRHSGARCLVLAGYLGSPRQWLSFGEKWRKELGKVGLSEFHATDFFAAEPPAPYSALSHEERISLVVGLARCIHSHRINPLGANVEWSVFRGFTKGERRFLTSGTLAGVKFKTSGAPSKPYFLLFQQCLVEAADKTKPGKVVHFVFDQQDEFSPFASTVFNSCKTLKFPAVADKMGSCTFDDRRKVGAPLEAADFLVHCWYVYTQRGAGLGCDEVRRQAHNALIGSGKTKKGLYRFSKEDIEMLLDRALSAEQRAALRETEKKATK
jgi:hypothetical protein